MASPSFEHRIIRELSRRGICSFLDLKSAIGLSRGDTEGVIARLANSGLVKIKKDTEGKHTFYTWAGPKEKARPSDLARPKKAEAKTSKFANRRDPYEVRRQVNKSGENWRDHYDHLTIVGPGGIGGCRKTEKKPRAKWEQNGNFFHVMKAFYMRVDLLSKDREEREKGIDEESLAGIDEMNPEENEISIPLWMASAIADGFKQYVSRRLYHKDDKASLDAIFRVDSKKLWKEFDSTNIDNFALLHETRKLQWYCGLAFSTALELALRIIKAECACENEEGEEEIFTFDHAKLGYLKAEERRGLLPTLGAWLEDEGLAMKPPAHLTADYLEYIGSLDRTIRSDIEAGMKDKRKKIHM